MTTVMIGERLKELEAFLAHQHAVESVDETLAHLRIEIEDAMMRSRASAQQCTILLFQSVEPPSLLNFLSTSADYVDDSRKREISAVRGGILELLTSFLKVYGGHRALSKQHVTDMYKICQSIARVDPFNRVKVHALCQVVINVLKYTVKKIDSEVIEPRVYVEKIFYDIKFSKATQTAKGQMLEVIGYLVERFSREVADFVSPLLTWTEEALQKQFSSNLPEMMIVNGLLFLLARLLECDSDRYTRDESQRKQTYSHLLTVLETSVSGKISRYQVIKSAELFLAKHAQMFQPEIGSSGYVWFSYMKFCCLSENKTIKQHAFKCSNAVFRTLNVYLVDTKDDMRKRCLNKILKEVLPVVSDSTANTSMMAFAVQCLGWFTQSIYVYLGVKSYNKIEEKLKTYGESLLALDAKATAWKWPLFSNFVQSIGQFVNERHDVPLDDGYVKFLGDILCHLMVAYPQCFRKSKVVVYESVTAVLIAVSTRTVVEPLVDRFVLHTLLLSISSVTGSDHMVIYHPDTGELVTNLLYDYEDFWLALLHCNRNALVKPAPTATTSEGDDVEMKEAKNTRRTLQTIVFDSIMKHFLDIVSGLNLSYHMDLQKTSNVKNAAQYFPTVPRDHTIMLNLTEFVERVIGNTSRRLLLPWIPSIMYRVFTLATKLPLVSCFYRIGTVVAIAIDDLKYFETEPSRYGSNAACFRSDFTTFIQRVCAQTRFHQDELLLTCAKFVLLAPIGLAAIDTMTDIVKSILELGKSYLPAAIVAINALERWQKWCSDKVEKVIYEVVPQLSTYLDQEDLSDELWIVKPTKTNAANVTNDISDLAQLQRRILLLLGKCSGKVSLLLSEPPRVLHTSCTIGCISSPYFRMDLQLNEVSASLAMEQILSHVGDLAAHSSVRRVKANASEGYHALICYLCGKTATHPHTTGKKTDFYDMWTGIFTRVVRLAADPEKICGSLFEPLLFQLLRWLATNIDSYPFEYASLLDELIQSLSDFEPSVRIISARCIATLLSLAVNDNSARVEVDEIFERLFSLCHHPEAIQRSGAATSISYFLGSLSEENGVVLARFAMPCLKNLLYAVRLYDSDSQMAKRTADVSQDVISKAVMKIERGISRFSHLFDKGNTNVRHTGMMNGEIILKQTTDWLFQQIGAREVTFRRLCRQIFMSFSVLICKSGIEWIKEYVSLHGSGSLTAVLVPMSSLALALPDITVEWMELLSASIESYVWCVELLGDEADDIFTLDELSPQQERGKRKHMSNRTDMQDTNCQSTISWAVSTFLKYEGPWEEVSMRSEWIKAYLLVLVSLCSCIKSLMRDGRKVLRNVADVDSPSFQTGMSRKLLLALLYRSDSWENDAKIFDDIKKFSASMVVCSQDWARQLQEAVGILLSDLTPSLTSVNSTKSFLEHSKIIESLVLIGSTVVSAGIVTYPASDKYAMTFALAASKAITYGYSYAQSRLVVAAALKAAAACGWRIANIFVIDADRQLYAPMYSDVIQFIPTLAVWKRCAAEVFSLSLNSSRVVNVLGDVLRRVATFKVYPAKSIEWDTFTETIVANILQLVKKLKDATTNTQQTLSWLQVLRYFLKLCQHCSETLVKTLRVSPIPDIQNAVIEMLQQREHSYLVKAEVLRTLTLLVPSSILVSQEARATSAVLDALVKFVFSDFPVVSVDVSQGSKEFVVFQLLFTELLSVIKQSGSIAYLKIVYPSLKEGEKHLFCAEIKQMLTRFSVSLGYGLKSGETKHIEQVQNQLAELVEVLLDPTLDLVIRKSLLEDVFTPVIECQTGETLQQFYLKQCPTKKSSIISLLATIISASPQAVSEGSRLGVFVAFSLVEFLYRLMDPEVIRTDINSAFLGHINGKGREFTMLVCKSASKVVTKAYRDVDEFVRLACCAAYNCLLTAVSRTQKQEKFFDQILFQPAQWSNIFDVSHEYDLHAETKEFATIPLSNLSAVSLQTRTDTKGTSKTKQNEPTALKFFTSSSLSIDLDTSPASTMTVPSDIGQLDGTYQNVDIELDALNQHPCIIPLLRVLLQMKTDFGSAWDENSMPGWMEKLYVVIVDPSASLNVRLFLAKVVLDVPEVFAMYRSSWLHAVMEALLDLNASREAPEFNYILRDCCYLALNSWNDVVPSVHQDTSSRFVNELIKVCPDKRNEVRDSNVLLITELIALWKDVIRIDVRILIDYTIADDEDRKLKSAKQFTALQCVSSMLNAGLANDLSYEDDSDCKVEAGILLVMTSTTTSLYTLAAEVGGLLLAATYVSRNEEFTQKLRDLIINSYNEEDFGRFLALLKNVSMHKPEIIDSMMLQRLSFVLPKAIAVDAWALLAAVSLSNAAANDCITKEVFAHVQPTLKRFIAHRHSGVQHCILQAINYLLDHLSLPELERLVASGAEGGFGLLESYEAHGLPECRGLLFTIVKKLYGKDLSDHIKEQVRTTLLRGLCDPDDARRKEAFEYWNTSEVMAKKCSDRLLAIFCTLYSPKLNERWVLYATNLLLGMSESSDAFRRPLYPTGLGNGEFAVTSIDASWEAKTSSMAPLFSVEADMFRATAASTLSGTADTFPSQVTGTMQSQLFSSKSASVGHAPSYSQTLKEPDSAQCSIERKRFSKRIRSSADQATSNYDKKVSKHFFQDKYAQLKRKEEAEAIRKKKERQTQVSMKRLYRVGEFPDIQITQQDIVHPIMALCGMHIETASSVFGSLFSAIVSTSQFENSGNCGKLAERLESILTLSKASSVYVGCIVSAIFASTLRSPKLHQMLSISPTVLGEAGLASGKFHLIELALEEQVLYNIQHHENRNVGSSELVTASWDMLYKLLSTVHKRNFLTALSLTCSTTDESKLALEAQLSGDLPRAIASYKKAEDILDSRVDIFDGSNSLEIKNDAKRCRWQRLHCLEMLNSWDVLNNEITDTSKKDNKFMWQRRPPYLEQGVAYYMRSCLGLSLKPRNSSSDILTSLKKNIDEAMKEPMKQELLQSRFPVEMCLTYLLIGDKNQASVYVETFYNDFSKLWRQTSPMASSTRLSLLQSLSSIVEIDEVLLCLEDNLQRDNKEKQPSKTSFIEAWKQVPPITGEDGMVLWSQHTLVQDTLASFLLDWGRCQGTLSDDKQLTVLTSKSRTMLQYAKVATSCNVLALASKVLKNYRELCNAHQLPRLSAYMVEVFVSHVLKLVDRQERQSDKRGLSSSLKLITKYYESATKLFDNVEIMNMMETADAIDQVAMGYLEAKTFASAAAFYASNNVGDTLKEEYFSRSLDMFKASCQRIDAVPSRAEQDVAHVACSRCRVTFIEFLNDLLFKQKMEKLAKLADRKALVKLLVENVGRGMAGGERECAHYFPQICDLIAPFSDIVAEFEEFVLSNVPLWTCLQWSAQLMALLNGPIGKTIVAILEKMAEQYPVALFYDFMVTCRSCRDKFKVNLNRLEVLLANPVMEKFVTALRLIHHPELRLKEGLREIAKLLEENRTRDAQQKVKLVWYDCFSSDRPLLGDKIGRYNRNWSRNAKREIEKIMGKDGSRLSAKSVASAREWIGGHFAVIPGSYGITKDMKVHIGDFAEWLEEFDHSSCSLELPGQYTAHWAPPNPSTHNKIMSFGSMLGVLASKQLPKRLILHCSDEKDYTFLVKGGEDLRLDQRIELLFRVMNQIFDADPLCRDRRLSLTTYDVIPMTREIGIVEWVSGTTTLKGVIETQLQIDERCVNLKSNKSQKFDLFNTTAAKAYESFLLKQRGASYSAKIIAPHSKDVVNQFTKVQAMIPSDFLRRQLLGMGSNYEAFLLVRDNFLKSLSVFNACSYILGIGDRHLDNFLLDCASGRVIGIDFGVSFGAGASVLPVPELIPFRYTRQMDFVFQPYDGKNLLAQEMQVVFEALRSKQQVVDSVMSVFLHEPLLDWQQLTTTYQKALFEALKGNDRLTLQDDDDVDMEVEDFSCNRGSQSSKRVSVPEVGGIVDTAWLPDVKIAIARKKLEGVSPALLLKEELSQNCHLVPVISKFHALVDTINREDDMDKMVTLSSLSQAQELLTMATAPAFLGRTFQGWMPWL
ncbi:hypothetical protein PsorP6_002231 [Peronosclerospora sorghi]|uniref:Uncharacterized protein n=1 Tax=Peronosclerospora sorghi TaxID=230839 RepID=A0ACC0WQV8_9STRA|nr:hypothetical protein PsorP6_002231 [Peronosclerospora sorghi]